MKKYYEDKKYNLAFERCIDIMSRLIQNNGKRVLTDIAIDRLLKLVPKEISKIPEHHVVLSRYKTYWDKYRSLQDKES